MPGCPIPYVVSLRDPGLVAAIIFVSAKLGQPSHDVRNHGTLQTGAAYSSCSLHEARSGSGLQAGRALDRPVPIMWQ